MLYSTSPRGPADVGSKPIQPEHNHRWQPTLLASEMDELAATLKLYKEYFIKPITWWIISYLITIALVFVTVCHCLSLFVTVCHCLSLLVTVCYCLSLFVTSLSCLMVASNAKEPIFKVRSLQGFHSCSSLA